MKPHIHITSAEFGKLNNKDYIIVPPQINDDFNITTKFYHDGNFASRENAMHPRLKGKIPKMLEWMNADADYYVWMDEPFDIVSKNFGGILLDALGDKQMALFPHPWNKTIMQETYSIIDELKKGSPYHIPRYTGEPMETQMRMYREDPNFIDDKLFAMGFFIFRKDVVENRDYNLFTDWFFHNCLYTLQDQISFPYLLYKHGVTYNTITSGEILNNDFAKYTYK
jgi:hypothetical protein